ncbi:hypothetical protein [Sinorhizobium fredii]
MCLLAKRLEEGEFR